MSKESTPRQIEAKFRRTAFRLTQERNDFLLPQVIDLVRRDKWVNLHPEYQRRLVWDNKKKSRFIESLLLNIPVPPLYLFEWDLNRYEVMDGQQRLNSIVEFYSNQLALSGLKTWHELNGLRYEECPDTIRRGLDRRRLSATVVLLDSEHRGNADKADVRKLVFERLNTGGIHLNAQELRNCLFAGPFNDLLISLASAPAFTSTWRIPNWEENVDASGQPSQALKSNKTYQRMRDCEIVLRFFAFRDREAIRGSVRAILDTCMERNEDTTVRHINALGNLYHDRLGLALAIFGTDAFRYRHKGRLRLSVPLYDAVMVALDRKSKHADRLIRCADAVRESLDQLLADKQAYEVIVGRPNTSGAILDRISMVEGALSSALRR